MNIKGELFGGGNPVEKGKRTQEGKGAVNMVEVHCIHE
jgi:hypothetical protein